MIPAPPRAATHDPIVRLMELLPNIIHGHAGASHQD